MGIVFYVLPVPMNVKKAIMPYHRYMGVVSLVLVTTAICLGCLDRQRIEW